MGRYFVSNIAKNVCKIVEYFEILQKKTPKIKKKEAKISKYAKSRRFIERVHIFLQKFVKLNATHFTKNYPKRKTVSASLEKLVTKTNMHSHDSPTYTNLY